MERIGRVLARRDAELLEVRVEVAARHPQRDDAVSGCYDVGFRMCSGHVGPRDE